jgi:hypothetical protein
MRFAIFEIHPERSAFQVNKRDHKTYLRGKQNLECRLERKRYTDQPRAMFRASNIVYEIAERTRAIGCGGIGALHTMVRKVKLDRAINNNVELLAFHVPYHESDHVLNIAYNVLSSGTCLEGIERLRNDGTYMNALDAEGIPDLATAGDFLRRFTPDSILELQETFNAMRRKLWSLQDRLFRNEAIIDVDGTVAGTTGECNEGMDIEYNGIWGYAPLIVSLANTNEVLYLVNRPGSRPSSDGAAEWMDRAIALTNVEAGWIEGFVPFRITPPRKHGCATPWPHATRGGRQDLEGRGLLRSRDTFLSPDAPLRRTVS